MKNSRFGAAVIAVSIAVFIVLPLGARAEEASTNVTFAKDIAPIFQEKCQACHRQGYMAPMSLVTYQEARPYAKAIKERVLKRQMPPWHIDRTVGIQQFENDRSLTDAQIEAIVRWVDAGAPQGDLKDMPPPKQFANDEIWGFTSQFGQPDLIVRSPAYTVKAVDQDSWYRPITDTGVTEPRWVRAIEIKPSSVKGRRITHHAVARLQQDEPGSGQLLGPDGSPNDDTGPGLFMEWAVGKQGEIMRPNSGKLLLPGSKIIWDIHYHAVGEEITDSVEMAIYFYPKGQEPKYRETLAALQAIGGGRQHIDIAPNSIWVSQNLFVMQKAGRVENFQPHMHLRGKAMSMEAIMPDGKTQVLSHVSNFNFNWHVNYIYAPDAAPIFPKGTMLRITAWYDNTTANPNNPDPNQWVGFGDRTVDEMGHAWVNITYMEDADYQAEMAKKKVQQASAKPE
jgi:mono/diheme cytochrome c family protein